MKRGGKTPTWWNWTKCLADGVQALQHWGTPRGLVKLLLDKHPLPSWMSWVCEPSVGAGSIARTLLEETPPLRVFGVEAHPGHTEALFKLCNDFNWQSGLRDDRFVFIIDDWLTLEASTLEWMRSLHMGIVANVPWKPAQVMMDHIAACVRRAPKYCALYLPTDAMQARKRAFWWSRHMPQHVILLADRASHSADGKNGTQNGVWCIWDAEWKREGKQKVEVCTWKELGTELALGEVSDAA